MLKGFLQLVVLEPKIYVHLKTSNRNIDRKGEHAPGGSLPPAKGKHKKIKVAANESSSIPSASGTAQEKHATYSLMDITRNYKGLIGIREIPSGLQFTTLWYMQGHKEWGFLHQIFW